jgi:hypothetical protein
MLTYLQLIEQALVIEEQLRKSYTENPALIEKMASASAAAPESGPAADK